MRWFNLTGTKVIWWSLMAVNMRYWNILGVISSNKASMVLSPRSWDGDMSRVRLWDLGCTFSWNNDGLRWLHWGVSYKEWNNKIVSKHAKEKMNIDKKKKKYWWKYLSCSKRNGMRYEWLSWWDNIVF